MAEYGKDVDTARLQGEVLTGKSVSRIFATKYIAVCAIFIWVLAIFMVFFLQTP